MWNYAHNRSTVGYTSEETSGWICSWITQDRCRTSGHRNTSPILQRAVCLSKHTLLITSGMSWRQRLIIVDIITQVETLSTHNWIKTILNLQQLLFCLSAHCPDQLFSPMQTHTHTLFCDWAPEHLCSGRKDRFPHLKSFYQKQTQLPWALLQPCQRLMAGSRTGLAPPGFPPWAWGLLNSKQPLKTQPKPLGATSIL